VREADLQKHLQSGQGAEEKDAAREKAREDARKRLEEESAKSNTPPKPLPEFGSAEDFQLSQALNRLKGKTVVASKTLTERKAEVETTN
jgi:carboxyl-terminal processing protease